MEYLHKIDEPLRWAGLDLGHARCGIALSDPGGVLATPVAAAQTQPLATLPQRIAGYFPPEGVAGLVAGLPLDSRGAEGESARAIRAIAEQVAAELGLPLEFQDERFSTAEVTRRRRETGRTAKQIRSEVDAFAAAAILQSWLDRRASQR